MRSPLGNVRSIYLSFSHRPSNLFKALHPHSPQSSPSSTFTRWEVPDPTTIENRAGVSAAAINHTSINHCHLALRQPHTSLSATPSACSPQECWVMRDGKGHPGIRLRAMLGRKERCVWACLHLHWRYLASAFIHRNSIANITRNFVRRRKVRATRWSIKEVYDREETGIIVDMFGYKQLPFWVLGCAHLSVRLCSALYSNFYRFRKACVWTFQKSGSMWSKLAESWTAQ